MVEEGVRTGTPPHLVKVLVAGPRELLLEERNDVVDVAARDHLQRDPDALAAHLQVRTAQAAARTCARTG